MKLVILGLVSASLVGVGTAEAHQGRAHYNAASSQGQHQARRVYSGEAQAYSRAQTWYSDTGWQPGTSAIGAYGYGYGYGGAGQHPPVIVAAPYQGAVYSQPSHLVQRSQPFGYIVDGYGRYPWVSQGGHGYSQANGCGPCQEHSPAQVPVQTYSYAPPAPQPIYYSAPPVYVSQPPIHVQSPPVYVQGPRVHVTPPPVHIAPPQVEVAPSQIIYDQGYFAAPNEVAPPPPPPPPPLEARSPTERPYRQEGGERG